MKKLLVLLFVLGVGFIAASLHWPAPQARPHAPRDDKAARTAEPDQGRSEIAPHSTTVTPEPPPLQEIIAPLAGKPSMALDKPSDSASVILPAPAPRPKDELMDPLAREALSLVGVDLDAEEYWLEAINNPALSAHERKELIEDLNEEGFADPRRPTLDDLPLIVSRIALIEQLVPDAMDQVNAEAFLEAYKDLWNMYVRLAGP